MKKLLNIYKPAGTTPLQIIEKFKEKHPKYKDKKIAYAGRLDPMAQGVLLLLVEPETKKREKYQNLNKEYEFQILFGVVTDTNDILGKIMRKAGIYDINSLKNNLHKIVPKIEGNIEQKYPAYSSKTVKGKPLYWWARKNRLNEINIPSKIVKIDKISVNNIYTVSKKNLSAKIYNLINKVKGDFRQNEIKKDWINFFQTTKRTTFPVAKLEVLCSSGTYIRSLANNIGKQVGTGGIALGIIRTSVGKYKIDNAQKI